MFATQTLSLPLHANPCRVDPCVTSEWIALPLTKNILGLWKTTSSTIKPQPIELSGHVKEIFALSFSNRNPIHYLASSCRDKILIWKLSLSSTNDQEITSKNLGSNEGEVTAMCFNNSDDLLAVASDFKVCLFIIGQKDRPTPCILEGHRAMITSLKFCPHYSATLVSISDDRSFCVWDVRENLLIYQSTIISSSPLISLCMNLKIPHFAIGTADGSLKIFDLTDGNNFRQLANIDLALNIKKKSQSNLMPNRETDKKGKVENLTTIQSSESVLAIEFVYLPQSKGDSSQLNFFILENSGANDILNDLPPSLCIITSTNLLQINSKTYEILDTINLQHPMKATSFSPSITIGPISYGALHQKDASTVTAVLGSMFEKRINVITLSLCNNSVKKLETTYESDHSQMDDLFELNIIPTMTLLSISPLKSEFFPQLVAKAITRKEITSSKKKPIDILNQPLTFQSKIKSSGYSQVPRTTMFKPETSRVQLLKLDSAKKKSEKIKRFSASKILKDNYDTSRGLPTELCSTFEVDFQTTAVSCLRFSDDGSGLACALSNKSGLIVKSPLSKQVSLSLIGHNSAVNSVFWSNNGSYVLTASNDKMVCVWNKTGGDSVMKLTHIQGTLKETQLKTSLAIHVDNKPFSKEIRSAQFFYIDKFILITHGPELLLYKYNITEECDDVKRYQIRNRHKLVATWLTPSSSFTAMAAVNTFFSYLVICTTSGRNLEVYDLNKSILAHQFRDCHSRSAHCVAINEGSCFSTQSQSAYNVIATIAPTDPIKLWDLRSRTNVHSLQGHLNNAHACQIAFSPCGNYIASGSEDRTVYLYDLRKGTYCERLRGHNEVVQSVAFHPATPFIATGSINSRILFFKPK
ncbi:unnamed protein product [Lymnaea stagnalis]|uniref:WD repeat-containing protein 27 n=1 Tax=Lymnaea stagnalis TaxID=6523 RepID=A0AAV2HER1_LYMST